MKTSRVIAMVALSILLAGVARVAAGPEGKVAENPPTCKATIADAAFIAGSWSATTEKRFTQEVWTGAKSGRMTGMFRWIKADGSPLLYELLTISEKDEGLEMKLAHFNADLAPLPGLKDTITLVATASQRGRLVFTPVENGTELRQIVYSGGSGALRIEVEYAAPGRSPSVFSLQSDSK